LIRSSILVREPCGRRGKKRRTRRQHLAGKRQALFSPSGRRRRGGRGTSARAALTKRGARAVLRDTPDRALPRETRALIAIAWRVESRRATDLEGVRFLGGGVVIARLGEHLGAGDELHGVRGGGLDEREALKIGGGGDGGHGDVRAVGGDARSADAGGDGGAKACEENEAVSKRRLSKTKRASETNARSERLRHVAANVLENGDVIRPSSLSQINCQINRGSSCVTVKAPEKASRCEKLRASSPGCASPRCSRRLGWSATTRRSRPGWSPS